MINNNNRKRKKLWKIDLRSCGGSGAQESSSLSGNHKWELIPVVVVDARVQKRGGERGTIDIPCDTRRCE